MGEEVDVELPGVGAGTDFERFRAKARQFLCGHEDHPVIRKLRWNQPLTTEDLADLERLLLEAGVGNAEDLGQAKTESEGLGIFVRSLVGLDRTAAKEAFGRFLVGTKATANQVEFINLVVDHLTERGVVDPAMLYRSPFTDLSPRGPEGLFSSEEVDDLVAVLREIRERAAA